MPTSTVFNFAKIGCWNIHGAYYNINGYRINKLEDPSFLEVLDTHDILCLQETHCGQNDLVNSHIHHYHGIPHCRKISKNNRYFGGMLLFIRKTLRKGIKIIANDDPDILGVLMLKDFFGLPEDLTVWFVYAPPLNTSYLTDREDVLDCLEKHIRDCEHPLILGDLNGKTKTAPDYIPDATDKHSPITDIDGYTTDTPSERNNRDDKPVDKQGKKILELCQSFCLRILNGRTAGDRWGLPTRYPMCARESPSLLDYALCSSIHLKKVLSFTVQPITDLSDHCCISCKISTLHRPKEVALAPTQKEATRRPKFDPKLADEYTLNLNNEPSFAELQNTLANMEEHTKPTQELLDHMVDKFNNGIINSATKSFPPKPSSSHRKQKPRQRKPAKWFNDECSKLRKSHRRALAKLDKNPYDTHLRELALHSRKKYRKACKEAESMWRKAVTKKLLEIKDNDPTQFWKIIKSMREWGKEKPDPADGIKPETWKHYYQSLLNKPNAKPMETPPGRVDPELDKPLLLEELQAAIKRAKSGKAFGPDGIQIEFIKYSTEGIIKILLRLMQMIFKNTMFPTAWTVNYLKPIYKKDCKDDPDNYRGLAIASTISKLYCMILLQRLETHMTNTNMISPNQIGFRRGYRTSDHVFLLKTLITKTLKQKKRLFAAFIDFKKAYDTVDRSLLLKSVHRTGVQGKFLSNLKAIYNKVSYSIKLNGGPLDPIESNLGLKQGCPLSPLLFNIYINDIGSYLKDSGPGNISVQGTPINHFLYADDLVLLAETKEGLQEHLQGLEKFAKAKELTVNTKKSVIMIFNKAGRKSKDNFTYNNRPLATVQSFTYLGVEISASGSFSAGIKTLVAKAKKAMFPLFRTIIQFRLPFQNALKFFTTYIEPILLYNVENWAAMTDKEIDKCKSDHSRIYENSLQAPSSVVQLKFLKFVLGVSKQCPTMAVLGETAEIPLLLKGYHRMLNYWNRVREMDDSTWVKKAYMENVSNNSNWCKTIQILNSSQNLHATDISNTQFPMVAKQRIRHNFTSFWRNRIDDRTKEKKLGVYSQVKKEYRIDDYLQLPHFRDRQRLTKFITSNHHLEIEKGRHNNKPREERICRACNRDAVEDEHHLLVDCPAYTNTRLENLQPLPAGSTGIEQVFSTNSPHNISQYLKSAFTLRDKLVNFHITKLSLCGMKMTITRGTDTDCDKLSTKLQATMLDGNKIRISRKGRRFSPYVCTSPIVESTLTE